MRKLLIGIIVVCWSMAALGGNVTCERCIEMINSFTRSNHDSAMYFAELGEKMCVENNSQLAMLYKLKGVSQFFASKYDSTLISFNRSLNLYKELNDSANIGGMYNNIGRIYTTQSNYPLAIDNYIKALEILQPMDSVEDKLAGTFINLGNVQKGIGQYENAIDSYKKAVEYANRINDVNRHAKALGNIANTYKELGSIPEAKLYAFKTLKIVEDAEIFSSIYTNALSVIGEIALQEKEFTIAEEHFKKALKFQEELNDLSGVSSNKSALGYLLFQNKKYHEAIEMCKEAYEIAESIKSISKRKTACKCLANAYEKINKNDAAFRYFKEYIELKDSIYNEDMAAIITQKALEFEFEKKKAQLQLKHEREQLLKEQEAQKSKLISMAAAFVLFLVIVFTFILNKRLKVTRQQKALIESQKKVVESKNEELAFQKNIVEEKSKEISDSIEYAQRIQQAILPPTRLMKKYLKNVFVLFNPKDIVSGDFYWLERSGDKILYAVADCTGHGVPGAMVSVVCNNALNRAVREYKITEPGPLLDKVRELVIETFERSEHEVKDGMDISLCCIEYTSTGAILNWAGANNPLYVVTKDKDKAMHWPLGKDLIELEGNFLAVISPNKQPIGKYADVSKFTTHKINLDMGDTIYSFTDGYADQFGGPNGKKFKYKPFKQLILSFYEKDLQFQQNELERSFKKWKANTEQIDDVCVIGVRI